jgi:hypothetical protein
MLKYIRMIELTRKMDEKFMAVSHAQVMDAASLKEFQKEIDARKVGHLFIEALRVRYGKTPWHGVPHAKLGGVKK